MTEYRTERVAPEQESDVAELLSTFGWVLVDSHEIYNESTEIVGVDTTFYGDGFVGGFMKGLTGKDGSVNVRTRTNVTNYVTLKFERDTAMPHYTKLKALNDEFESKMGYPEPKKPVRITVIGAIAVLIIVISIVMAIMHNTGAELWEILVCVLVPCLFVPLIAILWVRYKKKMRLFDAVVCRLHEILDEAQALL